MVSSLSSGADYEHMFELAPVSLWLEDFSELKRLFDGWRAQGVTDIRSHLAEDPARLRQCSASLRVLQVNRRTLELFSADNQQHLEANLDKVFRDDRHDTAAHELAQLWDGQMEFANQTVNYALDGRRLDVLVRARILPGHEADWSRVLVSLEDNTQQLEAARRLRRSEQYARDLFEHSPVSLWVEDFSVVKNLLDGVRADLAGVLREAGQGALLRDGMTVVIAGRPNAGKSSLLNALAGREAAIVTDIAGTTRDVLREHILIDGMPLHVVDTAGLRATDDQVEKIGVARALQAISEADRVLLVVDATAPEAADPFALWPEFLEQRPDASKVTLIRNKADLSQENVGLEVCNDGHVTISLSAKSADGLELLREHLKACMGYEQTAESSFSARRRHLEALRQASTALEHGRSQLTLAGAGELLAEDLRQAQQVLGEITGAFSSDDLLGRIFSSFCIGK